MSHDEKHIIVLDLETKRLFGEVGGGNKQNHLLGISTCGIYDSKTNEYRAYHENQLHELKDVLASCDLVVGFNSISFDFAVLQPYYPDFDLKQITHRDILVDITNRIGHRLKLESVVESTLLSHKSGAGLDAVKYYRLKDWESLDAYCLNDVKLTRMLYDYGCRHGRIWYHQGGAKTPIQVTWSETPTIEDVVRTAYMNGEQLGITYLVPEDVEKHEFLQHVIDVQNIKDNKVTAWCHTTESQMVYDLNFIMDVNVIGKMNAFQASLL